MKALVTRISLSLLVLTFIFQASNGNISLPEIFSDNMVLQQKSDVTIWGWAKTGEKVVLKADWLTAEINTTADTQGKWSMILKTPEAGGPYNISLKGYNEVILKNVLIGEVWLCSGQSNMEWSAAMGINNAEEEIKNAQLPGDPLFFGVSCHFAIPAGSFHRRMDGLYFRIHAQFQCAGIPVCKETA